MSFLPAVKIWIRLSVLASLAGWLLTVPRQLSVTGYVVFALVCVVIYLEAWGRGALKPAVGRPRWRKFRLRFRRGLPLMFGLLALLVFVGGVLYPPTNHTALSYRIPRVLHWLNAKEWTWIWTHNPRMNTRSCGIEWLSAPLILFTKSDRALFLLNFIPFLLLPGLIFSVLTRLGVRLRVAWHWMWLLPTGHVFLLQAGSAGNDAFPTVYALAAVDFACRAWKSRRVNEVWYSILAMALLTGAKASNLPLGLPWFVLLLPLLPLLKTKPLGTARVVLLALIVSFLPTAILNLQHCGSWSGLQLESANMSMRNPVVGVWGNTFLLALNNLCPPFFPLAGWWTQHAARVLPGALIRPLDANFESGYLKLWELPTEDWAGIGPAVSALMLVSAVWAVMGFRRRQHTHPPTTGISPLVLRLAVISPWLSLLAYCALSGMVTPARLIAPYYPLLLPWLLVGAEQSVLVRRRWWRVLEWTVYLMSFAVLITAPARPLWPAQTILARAVRAMPENQLLTRALNTYSVYSVRADTLAQARAALPPDLELVGFLSGPDDIETSLWRPYGTRRVEWFPKEATAEEIRAHKIQYAVVSVPFLEMERASFPEWLQRTKAEVVADFKVTVSVGIGAQHYYVVRFKD